MVTLLKENIMSATDLYKEKLEIINWISELEDIALIKKIKDLKQDANYIPQWQKDEVQDIIPEYKKNPEIY